MVIDFREEWRKVEGEAGGGERERERERERMNE